MGIDRIRLVLISRTPVGVISQRPSLKAKQSEGKSKLSQVSQGRPNLGRPLSLQTKLLRFGRLRFHIVDVATKPWKVVQEKCAGYRIIDNGDGTGSISPTITPARKRTLFIKTMAAAVE